MFFLFFVAITILTEWRRSNERRELNLFLIFGAPLATLDWQSIITRYIEHGLGYSTVGMAALYLVLATVLIVRRIERLALLREIFLFFGLLFATLAVPYFYDNRITAAVWAIAGAAWVWWWLEEALTSGCCCGGP